MEMKEIDKKLCTNKECFSVIPKDQETCGCGNMESFKQLYVKGDVNGKQ